MPKDPQSFGILIKVLQAYIVNMSKLQHFRADSEYLGKINTKKKIKFFSQCLVLPKDPQSFGSQTKVMLCHSTVAVCRHTGLKKYTYWCTVLHYLDQFKLLEIQIVWPET